MDLDRGTLAKIDRRVLSGLGHDERYQMVRLLASEAMWSTWKRYCDAVAVSMGRAIVVLIENELRSVVGDANALPVFLEQVENRLAQRERSLDARERELEERASRLSEYERRVRVATPQPHTSPAAKVGRNDQCPCGSGLKYKRCHAT